MSANMCATADRKSALVAIKPAFRRHHHFIWGGKLERLKLEMSIGFADNDSRVLSADVEE